MTQENWLLTSHCFGQDRDKRILNTQTAFDYDLYSTGLSFFCVCYLLTCAVSVWALQ